MKILIVIGKYGQLCNRLFMISHVLSYAIENNYKVYIANFDDYKKYFDFKGNNSTLFTFYDGLSASLLRYLGVALKRLKILPKITSFDSIDKSKKKYVFINEWNLLHLPYIQQNRARIASIFKFNNTYLKDIPFSLSEEGFTTIGIHIRLGDYQNWKGGIYYFPMQFYINLIDFYISKYHARFIICSNENIVDKVSLQDNIFVSKSNFVTDLWLLSNCDYIIGPPSTFNAWASFIGKTPLYTVKSVDQLPKLEKFKIFNGNLLELTN